MEYNKFSVFDSIVYGFKSVVDHFRLFFLASVTQLIILIFGLITVVVSLGISFTALGEPAKKLLMDCNGKECAIIIRNLLGSAGPIHLVPFLIAILVAGIIGYGIMLGYIKMALEFYDIGTSRVGRLFSCFAVAPRAIITWIVFSVIVLFGFLLLILPGIYWGLRFYFFSYFIVDKNAGIIESLQKSWAITADQAWPLFCLSMIIMILGRFAMPLNYLILAPVALLANTYVYRQLEQPTKTL